MNVRLEVRYAATSASTSKGNKNFTFRRPRTGYDKSRVGEVVLGTLVTRMSGFRFFTTEQIDDATVARPVDAYLQGTALAELLRLELQKIVEVSGSKSVILDFRNVKLISSSVISSLLGLKRSLAVSNIPLKMCGMSESLRHVFRTLNMDGSVFCIVDDVSSALEGEANSKVMSYYDVCGRLSPPDEENP